MTSPDMHSIPWHSLRRYLAPVLLFSVVTNLIYLMPSLYIAQIYERVLVTGSLPTLGVLSLGLLVLLVLQAVLDYTRAGLLANAAISFDRDARSGLSRLLFASGRPSVGYDQAQQDCEIIKQFLGSPLIGAIFDIPWAVLFLIVLGLIHPFLGLLALGFGSILLAVAWATQAASRQPNRAAQMQNLTVGRFSSLLGRIVPTLQSLGLVSHFEQQWASERDRLAEQQIVASQRIAFWSAVSRAIRIVSQSAVMGLGAVLAIYHEISPGSLFAATILLGRALSPIDLAVSNWKLLATTMDGLRRTASWFAPAAPSLGVDPGSLTGAIQLTDVKLVIGAKTVLDNISFRLPEGATLAIVGPSGSGKTSLLQVIAGAIPYGQGEVCIGDIRVEHLAPGARNRNLGVLPQSVDLLPGSIRDNIARFQQTTDAAVIEAAKSVGAHELIGRLPHGYATEIGAPDCHLSPGQAQRIALARAVFQMPAVVILDEPNSALDGEGEAALTRVLHHLKAANRTVVVAAHRPSILTTADFVAVMLEGRLVQFGPTAKILPHLVPAAGATVASIRSVG